LDPVEIEMVGRDPFEGPYRVRMGERERQLGMGVARTLSVERRAR
jgi:hypothetical protein